MVAVTAWGSLKAWKPERTSPLHVPVKLGTFTNPNVRKREYVHRYRSKHPYNSEKNPTTEGTSTHHGTDHRSAISKALSDYASTMLKAVIPRTITFRSVELVA